MPISFGVSKGGVSKSGGGAARGRGRGVAASFAQSAKELDASEEEEEEESGLCFRSTRLSAFTYTYLTYAGDNRRAVFAQCLWLAFGKI